MRTAVATTCLAAAILTSAGCQKPPEFTDQDAAAVRAMFDSAQAQIRRADWVRWSRLYTQDGVIQPPNAKSVRGRPAILAWGQGYPHIESISFSRVQVTGEGNMAYGSSDYVVKIADMPADSGKQLVVFRRQADGSWMIPAVSFSSDLPPMAPPAAAPARRH